MKIKAPRGTVDLLPEDTRKWQYVEEEILKLCKAYNFEEIRTPIFEHTEVFQRGVGETTDIVQKEMYTFEDRGGRSITLRPEGTAGVVRAYNQHKMFGQPNQPTKLFYFAEMFRYERPQAGRMRQLNQFGVEVLGSDNPQTDAEVIALAMTIYKKLGVKNIKLVLNSLGDAESRNAHRDALIQHFTPHIGELCENCNNRLLKNPLRILDCKEDMNHPAMKTAPSILEYLNDYSKEYFEKVKANLDALEISYEVDPTLVRGLDYYNHTAFEVMLDDEGFGAITTLLGGGRYNGLAEQLGGPETPGIGFGMGLERLFLALETSKVELPVEKALDAYFITLGEVDIETMKLMQDLRESSIKVDKDYQDRKMKAQFKSAERFDARFVLILGEDEIKEKRVTVKEQASGDQEDVHFDDLTNYLLDKLGGK